MRLLLLLCACLFSSAAFAQATVSGRVVDAKSDEGLPGVTVLQSGTANGVSSDVHGYFSFTVPNQPDSVALTVSSIGYLTQRLRVAAGSNSIIRLVVDPKPLPVCRFGPPRAEVGVFSGMHYAPFGGTLRLYGPRLFRQPLAPSVSYQTNFARNHALHLGLGLPAIHRFHSLNITETLDYQRLRAPGANTAFDSYTATLGLNAGFIGGRRLPTFLLGAGYAEWRSIQDEVAAQRSGYGYTAGLQFNALPEPFNVYVSAQATRWPDAWQWQGRLLHGLPHNLQAGVALNQLRSYTEVSLLLNRLFY
ncbi:carboxypeptidase-like regulatory domain-containing protein [Hymenobacter armeniacus]|uniref:Carboxypeptidase-like regulatory domain-containing protein n=1 Tax=Hymenobacter armeniacus TaxID=2771358 RepID=A0ABR8JSR6_9BACT|nr:carboxypeptidase-like regulatory domain-containing protein [Hymenobacter armeniacus]MBD2721846.1 carboxypeptidase-like regulatory domain-containing protein [Hymenobacter armeniacus]